MITNQIDIFSTPIWDFQVEDQQTALEELCAEIKHMAALQPSVFKSNVGGWQSKDDLHKSNKLFETLATTLEKYANDALEDAVFKPVCVTEMWANVNSKYCSNIAHTHSGILSGVFYLQVSERSGRLVLRNPAIRSDSHYIRAENYVINPRVLKCVLFPSWLEHYVEPNLSEDLRISVSFNIGLYRANM